ncbi:MAG: class I SAM-dependent methyltransferase [Myxococcales bacterium]
MTFSRLPLPPSRRAHLAGDGDKFPLSILLGGLEYLDARSVLEVGAGVGRCMGYLKAKRPHLRVVGVEPDRELRAIARSNGIPAADLIAAEASRLPFNTQSFDVVCAIDVLHHVRDPSAAVCEMLRVATKGVFISDGNNFGQGRLLVRSAKQVLNALGLWKVANWVKTKGKGYTITEGDGLAYSYSVFNDYELLRSRCRVVHLMNMAPGGRNPYRTASHIAVLALK